MWKDVSRTAPSGAAGRGRAVLSLKAGKIILLGATCGLLAAAVNVSALIGARQGELGAASRCAACTASAGVELEFARLEQRIAAAVTPTSVAGVADAQLRFDMLEGRMAALDAPDVRALWAGRPELGAAIDNLRAAVRSLGPLMGRVDRPEVGEAALGLMAPLDFELSRLTAEAERLGEARTAAGQAELGRLYRVFTAVLAALFAFGATLLAVLFHHNRRLGEARDGLAASKAELEAASLRIAAANGEISATAAARAG